MITVENKQDTKVNISTLESDAQKIINHLGYGDFALGIQLCNEQAMQEYNKKYRDKDKPTDILSFLYYPNLKPGERIHPKTAEDKNLGDIILCPEYVQKNLEQWNQDFETRMKILLVHGICHLLAYDHIQDADYEIMRKKEAELLSLI